jgi:hypothetical protein
LNPIAHGDGHEVQPKASAFQGRLQIALEEIEIELVRRRERGAWDGIELFE